MVLNPGDVLVWRARLDAVPAGVLPAVLPQEAARAARFSGEEARLRYLRSHGILRAILARLDLPDYFLRDDRGKPYLDGHPDVHFSLSRSHGMALYAVSHGAAVGVDVERIRPLPEFQQIAERFLPPSAHSALLGVAAPAREAEFFRVWTRLESALKAIGVGLYGAGHELTGDWTVEDIPAGEGFAAAVAARAAGCRISVTDFEC